MTDMAHYPLGTLPLVMVNTNVLEKTTNKSYSITLLYVNYYLTVVTLLTFAGSIE